MAEPERDIETR